MKKFFSAVTVILLIFNMYIKVSACTIFNKQQNGRVLVGNNEDWTYSIPSTLWIVASDDRNYGRICFAISSYVQGGMNEKGLFYDGATCPKSKVPYVEGKPELKLDMGEVIISKCANVQEVIKMVKDYNIPQDYEDHLMFTDSSGDSVVIEWMENEMKIIPQTGEYQLITNFWLSKPQLGGYPSERYNKAKLMLEDNEKDISVNAFADILKATAQNWGDGGTKYSNVYDLNNREIFVYNKGNFNKVIKFNLNDELKNLKKGQKNTYNLEDLFSKKQIVHESPLENTDSIKSALTGLVSNNQTKAVSADNLENVNNQAAGVSKSKINDFKGFISLLILVLIVIIIKKVILMRKQ
jgi:choloylglycine hydrolase